MQRIFRHTAALVAVLLYGLTAGAQSGSISGEIVFEKNEKGIPGVSIFLLPGGKIKHTDSEGKFRFEKLKPGTYRLETMSDLFKKKSAVVELKAGETRELRFTVAGFETELGEVRIDGDDPHHGRTRLKPIEGTAIYAGKKTEVIHLDEINANLAANTSRQIYSKVAGLNIWESDGAGLQLGIGGRGLSPNRTSNFNTRQNGYDISADALGYPESYYTPPAEAVDRIEVVRGAASLQYGTQFGGMLNFKLRSGPKDRAFQLRSRSTVGSFGFHSLFHSAGGQVGKVNYYGFHQYKTGDGWRENSGFDNHTAFGRIEIQASPRLGITAEYTHMRYIAQQAGGLTDAMFEQDPRQSIRERNWFRVNWNLASISADYHLTENTRLNLRTFGLFAEREALGFLGIISRTDPLEERDLIRGRFRNLGSEARLLHKFDLGGRPSAWLIGARAYTGQTQNQQGYASDGYGPDFSYINPTELEHSDYEFPSANYAAFSELYIALPEGFSVTPGLRYEYIQTGADGYYFERSRDLAGNILREQKVLDEKFRRRQFVLAGLGLSWAKTDKLEAYGNISQNYRAINFNDLRIVNPNFRVDENLQDERGFTADLGLRGSACGAFSYDFSVFYIRYRDRIGVVLKEDEENFSLYRYRTNVADSRNFGVEGFMELDLFECIGPGVEGHSLNLFMNFSLIRATYFNSDEPAIEGKLVEQVPPLTLRSGITYTHKRFSATLQHSYVHEHFTDATNARLTSTAVNGIIPSYQVADFSVKYGWQQLKFYGGINNLSNNTYFTRRAAGYPGPGIIPADGRNFYLGLELVIGTE